MSIRKRLTHSLIVIIIAYNKSDVSYQSIIKSSEFLRLDRAMGAKVFSSRNGLKESCYLIVGKIKGENYSLYESNLSKCTGKSINLITQPIELYLIFYQLKALQSSTPSLWKICNLWPGYDEIEIFNFYKYENSKNKRAIAFRFPTSRCLQKENEPISQKKPIKLKFINKLSDEWGEYIKNFRHKKN